MDRLALKNLSKKTLAKGIVTIRMASATRQATGRLGEDLATEYLQQQGYRILARNARTSYGEIDLVAQQQIPGLQADSHSSGQVLVFVEVKTRRSQSFGLPEESVTSAKRAHMQAAAQAYLQANPELYGDWRLDVIAVRLDRQHDKLLEIVHFENVIP